MQAVLSMAGFRAFYDFQGLEKRAGDILALSEDESRHLCGSLRAVETDKVDAFDLRGFAYSCVVARADKKRAELAVTGKISAPADAPKVCLAQCLPKGKVFDDIIRQAVEIGASGIFPIVSRRCQVRFDSPADAVKKREKWTAHVIEAVKQSANFFPFEIYAPASFEEFLSNMPNFGLKITASLESGARPILEILESLPAESVCILIGPEGDMAPEEYAAAKERGFLPATLGANVMKCDTAAIFALSAAKAFFAKKVGH